MEELQPPEPTPEATRQEETQMRPRLGATRLEATQMLPKLGARLGEVPVVREAPEVLNYFLHS